MRYLKLELTWDASPWVANLSDGGQIAWLKLLAYAKGSGAKGKVKRLEPAYAARVWLKAECDIESMENAALRDGALSIEEGYWIVTNWLKYQGDESAKTRMQRHRESKQPDSVTDVTRNARNVTLVTHIEFQSTPARVDGRDA